MIEATSLGDISSVCLDTRIGQGFKKNLFHTSRKEDPNTVGPQVVKGVVRGVGHRLKVWIGKGKRYMEAKKIALFPAYSHSSNEAWDRLAAGLTTCLDPQCLNIIYILLQLF